MCLWAQPVVLQHNVSQGVFAQHCDLLREHSIHLGCLTV